MSYTNGLDNPELYFQTKLYTGNGSTQSITLDGSEDMQPDFVWIKQRNASSTYHWLGDSVRGVTKYLSSNVNSVEATETTQITSFDSDGFSLGNKTNTNDNSDTYVAWCWKESADAGFDIVSYTGNGSNRTISHSLSAVPKVMFVKKRSGSASDWTCFFEVLGNTKRLILNDNSSVGTATTWWNSTTPTSSVFSLGTSGGVNDNSETYINYLFAEKKGYSKFFQYEGNSNSDGTFVYLGFRPAWLMVKPVDASDNWVMFDNKRHNAKNSTTAPYFFYANKDFAETTDTKLIDLLSNGFKIRSSGNTVNRSSTFVGMAFAESPFVNSNGVPNNAR
jgi:hypothetical protein